MTAREFLEVTSWIAAIAGTAFGMYVWISQDNKPKTHVIDHKATDIDVEFVIGTWRDVKGGKDTIRAAGSKFEYSHHPPSVEGSNLLASSTPFQEIKIQTVIHANGEWFILRTNPDGKRTWYAKESNDRLNIDRTEVQDYVGYVLRE